MKSFRVPNHRLSSAERAAGEETLTLRPTAIPKFDVDDYARRCDASLRAAFLYAMPPLNELARRYRSPIRREEDPRRVIRKSLALAALLRTFVDEKT